MGSDHLHDEKCHAWCTTPWPQLVTQANAKKALRRFGDEASFPQWGTLSYPWARRGHQPVVKTSGKRKGSKVFGLIDDCTGRCWSQGQQGRLNSEDYSALLTRVVAQTQQPIVLIQEGATYHTAAAMQRFFAAPTERFTVFQVPSSSPDDHPIETLGQKVKNEGTQLHSFPTFDALTATVEQALLTFAHTPAAMLALCSLPTA